KHWPGHHWAVWSAFGFCIDCISVRSNPRWSSLNRNLTRSENIKPLSISVDDIRCSDQTSDDLTIQSQPPGRETSATCWSTASAPGSYRLATRLNRDCFPLRDVRWHILRNLE